MAEALYRKYRPQIFEDVVGQEHIERTLKNALEQDKVSHAYLFCGPRGTGKTTTARLLAKALLCEKGLTPEPDGTCDNCIQVAEGNHPDVYELDAASRTGVENVREEIIGRVQFAPTRGRYKVYIIDEVHMLSTAAFNALLKTLEEPPDHVIFVLCTTDPHKVPETIHSRCQRFDFRRIAAEAMVSRLGAICVAEDVSFEGDALDLIAHRAEGGLRNALTSLEQMIAFGEGNVTLELAERLLGSLDVTDMAEIVAAIGKRDIAACFTWTANYVETGADLAHFVRDLGEHIRNMYVLSLAGNDTPLEISEATRRELITEKEYFGADRLARQLGVLGDLSAELKTSSNPRLSFEIALTRMVRPDSDLTLESLAERIEALEAGHSAVAVPGQKTVAASAQNAAGIPTRREPTKAQQEQATGEEEQTVIQENAQFAGPREETLQEAVPLQEIAQPQVTPQKTPQEVQAVLENPASLQRIWQATLAGLKKQRTSFGALFLNTKASFDPETQGITIGFPASSTFAYSAVQKPETMTAVKECLIQATGGEVPFKFVQQAATANATDNSQPTAQPTPTQPTPQSTPTPQPAQVAPQTNQSLVQKSQPTEQSSVSTPQESAGGASTFESSNTTSADTTSLNITSSNAASTDTTSALESALVMGFGEGISFEEV